MRRLAAATALTLAIAIAGAAPAATTKVAPSANPHIVYVRFNQDGVTTIRCELGVSTLVDLGPGEIIETISAGDSKSWSIVPKKRSGIFFVKPLEQTGETNVNVVTNKRVYALALVVGGAAREKAAYQVRFKYPDEELAASRAAMARESARFPDLNSVDPQKVNRDYEFKGSRRLKPRVAFDNGTKTFLQFAGDVPAIFEVGAGGAEKTVNSRVEGGYVVIDRVAAQFTLRQGDETLCLFNRAAKHAPEPDEVEAVYGPQEAQSSFLRRIVGGEW